MMSLHLVENKVVRVSFHVLGNSATGNDNIPNCENAN